MEKNVFNYYFFFTFPNLSDKNRNRKQAEENHRPKRFMRYSNVKYIFWKDFFPEYIHDFCKNGKAF